tara:strand:+ start:152 stop:388 length:237 start_codon:yes stop_codon:yes gene_type:complete
MELEPNEIELILLFLERAMTDEAAEVGSYQQGGIYEGGIYGNRNTDYCIMRRVEKLARITRLFLKAAEGLGYDLQEVK